GAVSAPLEGLPANLYARQGLFEARADRAFASNRIIYLTYAALPDGIDAAALPRSPGVLLVARARLSSDDRRLEGVEVLINADGTIPRDNPFAGRSGARPEVFALGFRDMQGIAIEPRTGRVWTSEHGPRGGDEINVVKRGAN